MTMAKTIDSVEKQRLALQSEIDAQKTQAERNRLGQFATPPALALDILKYAATLLPKGEKVRFLDPAIGTGSFYSALRKVFPKKRIGKALGFEIDPLYEKPASALWSDSDLTIKLTDFTREEPSPSFNLVICNPPYVRHHHLQNGDKARLQFLTQQASGMKLSGLAGLYCYFLGLSHGWMAQGCIAGWLIPSEFMDVNYGKAVKQYLLDRVTLLHIHRFDPNNVQFADALVSSAVVWFKNAPPPPNHEVKFTFGGTLSEPRVTRYVPARVLAYEPKWTRFPASDVRVRNVILRLSDLFQVKRGLATGDNSYFILAEDEIVARGLPMEVFTPILPSPRYLQQDEVKARKDGTPDIERRLFLLNTKLTEDEIRRRFPALAAYLDEGKAKGIHERYLCKHRSPWYSQEDRPPAPIVCTYLGRSDARTAKPFRFILNGSRATVANVYLALYPTRVLASELDRDSSLLRRIWSALNELPPNMLLGEGRVYGGGLHKLEPRELSNVPATFIQDLLPHTSISKNGTQIGLFAEG
ncbi:Modification methylase Eco57IB [Calidithermus terrae]|uniref:site-specific DNA-methyltransferase (adenine-specific) n=2 Tax=Calidithermus terrae TaxID=1408545 RepID=A0A399EW00_9DEIN|nr:Modification methylase Eco57IB [Calidithermus terrae]